MNQMDRKSKKREEKILVISGAFPKSVFMLMYMDERVKYEIEMC